MRCCTHRGRTVGGLCHDPPCTRRGRADLRGARRTNLEGPRHPMSTSELQIERRDPDRLDPDGPAGEGSLRMMTVHAHPDDESSKGAATCARYVAEGREVMVVTCTGGERGSILNPAMDKPGVLDDMPAIRRAEMARAAELLGGADRWRG